MASGAVEWFRLFIPLAILLFLLWISWHRNSSPKKTMATDRLDLPYKVFSNENDIECLGRDVQDFLYPEYSLHYPGTESVRDFAGRLKLSQQAYKESSARSQFDRFSESDSDTTLISFLVDQSGSMADQMPVIAGELRAVCEALAERGFAVGLFGHTTRGWKGGNSRLEWQVRGEPPYPGRLADMLYVTYKDFDSELVSQDWTSMMLPNALHENIDGEALEWLGQKLIERAEIKKIIIVISDGASVDDSTLQENGAGYLERHLLEVISRMEGDPSIYLGAIGIDHWVERYYSYNRRITDATELPFAVASLTEILLKSGMTKS